MCWKEYKTTIKLRQITVIRHVKGAPNKMLDAAERDINL